MMFIRTFTQHLHSHVLKEHYKFCVTATDNWATSQSSTIHLGPGRGVCNDRVKFWEKSNLVPDISKVISVKDNRTQEGCNAINLPSGERTDRVKQLSSSNLVIAVTFYK